MPKRDPCSGTWAASFVQAVWLRRPDKVKDKRAVTAWLKGHKFPAPRQVTRSANGQYYVAQVRDPKSCKCFRYGKWMAGGQVRFLYCGNPRRKAK